MISKSNVVSYNFRLLVCSCTFSFDFTRVYKLWFPRYCLIYNVVLGSVRYFRLLRESCLKLSNLFWCSQKRVLFKCNDCKVWDIVEKEKGLLQTIMKTLDRTDVYWSSHIWWNITYIEFLSVRDTVIQTFVMLWLKIP